MMPLVSSADEAPHRERHVESVLDVVINRVAAGIARHVAAEQAFEIVEGQPQLVERRAWKRRGVQLPHGIAHVSRIAYLHRVRDVIVVAPILGHDTFLVVVGRIARTLYASGVSHAVILTATEFHSPAGA